MGKINAMIVVGARPNFMKASPLVRAMKKSGNFVVSLMHTGQHYDFLMSKSFFRNLNLPRPNIYLAVGSDTAIRQTAKIMIDSEKHLLKLKPDVVIVLGDVNSTIAVALAAKHLNIPVAHVEAGLRSRDMSMPEEINRILTDHISDFLFTTEESANKNLIKEGIDRKKIYFTGNVMIDSLLFNFFKIRFSSILHKFKIHSKEYALLTLHRPSNVDKKENFLKILESLKTIEKHLPIIFPVHPRTKKQIENLKLLPHINRLKKVVLIPPLGYIDFMKLALESRFILTDSGGIQEESTVLGTPCVTLRENTERPATVASGANVVAGTNPKKVIFAAKSIIFGKPKKIKIPKYWDGNAAERIVKILSAKFTKK